MRYSTILIIAFVSMFPGVAFASEVFFRIPDSVYQGEAVTVDVILRPATSVNAIEGTVTFTSDVLDVRDLRWGNSPVSLWLDRPKVTSPGTIAFTGLFPGGIDARDEKEYVIFSFSATPRAPGNAHIDFGAVSTFLNGPNGTQEINTTAGSVFTVKPSRGNPQTVPIVVDFNPPELFTVSLVHTPDAFDGKTVAVFSAVDKASGVTGYEVRERFLGVFGSWRDAQSPYVLEHQSGLSIIDVRASDALGHTRTVRIIPLQLWIVGIGALVAILYGMRGLILTVRSRRS